jgi:hypothetical protein
MASCNLQVITVLGFIRRAGVTRKDNALIRNWNRTPSERFRNMMDILNDVRTWSILKWIIIVLIAGFIGQFGKTMAQAVMRKIQLKKIRESNSPPTIVTEIPAPPAQTALTKNNESTSILDKKMLKTISKQQKKAAKRINKVE